MPVPLKRSVRPPSSLNGVSILPMRSFPKPASMPTKVSRLAMVSPPVSALTPVSIWPNTVMSSNVFLARSPKRDELADTRWLPEKASDAAVPPMETRSAFTLRRP